MAFRVVKVVVVEVEVRLVREREVPATLQTLREIREETQILRLPQVELELLVAVAVVLVVLVKMG